jgi:V8-like Glu-specific endopeptidase
MDRTVTLRWYLLGLERTKSVARIEREDGRAKGTAWLVNASDFFLNKTGLLLLTNAHVVNLQGNNGALKPDEVFANFQRLSKRFALTATDGWSSPPSALDTTFLKFKQDVPEAEPIPVLTTQVELNVPPQRLYIIGHPSGRDIELSIHDNKLVKCVEKYLHYRTPTESGSSGSPVFEHTGWKAVALHHAGETSADGAGNRPSYEANEGIAIHSLIQATMN